MTNDAYETLPNGKRILKDGARISVPLRMRDAASISVGRTADMQRPGFRVSDAGNDDACSRAYLDVEQRDRSAWKRLLSHGATSDAENYEGSKEGSSCTTNDRRAGTVKRVDGRLVCIANSSDATTDERAAAYAEREFADANAWRNLT